jgi:hypothetical protein
MRTQSLPQLAVAVAAACAVSIAMTLLLSPAQRAASPPVRMIGGVPVGVKRTPAGALAAADNYVALEAQSIEQDPRTFAALLTQAYTPTARARTQSQARRIRMVDRENVKNFEGGGRGLAVIAARSLASWTPRRARVRTWLAGLVWGPELPPRQTWNLVDTTLVWQGGRWLVAAMDTSSTPAPVPSVVYVEGGNNRTAAFARLAGMSAPFYGAAE